MARKKVPNFVPVKSRTFVYFVRAGEFIKIGQSKTWKNRVATMQVGSPHTIIVLLVLVADRGLEARLHTRFRNDHFRGEWFHSGPAILAYIKEHLPECVSKSGLIDLRIPSERKPPRPPAVKTSLANSWDDFT
ncbi:GIY-YIG nuclease family protein [Bradyrhizobium ottawaense]|jgi:hypothetical protein